MANKLEGVLDSGPLIHTQEIDALRWTRLFSKIHYPPAVYEELKKRKETQKTLEQKVFKEARLTPKAKKQAEVIYTKYGLNFAESEAISLARQEKITIFLTDDLEARAVSLELGLRPVGSVGLLLKAFREKLIRFSELENKLQRLLHESSLFITPQLILEAIKEARKHNLR